MVIVCPLGMVMIRIQLTNGDPEKNRKKGKKLEKGRKKGKKLLKRKNGLKNRKEKNGLNWLNWLKGQHHAKIGIADFTEPIPT